MKELKRKIIDMYMDYANNFITLQGFANHYCISVEKADKVINTGRKLNDNAAKKLHDLKQSKIDQLFKTVKF